MNRRLDPVGILALSSKWTAAAVSKAAVEASRKLGLPGTEETLPAESLQACVNRSVGLGLKANERLSALSLSCR